MDTNNLVWALLFGALVGVGILPAVTDRPEMIGVLVLLVVVLGMAMPEER